MTNAITREIDFNEISRENLVASAKVTVNNLYEVLENCQTAQESKQISGCIYLLETSLFGKSYQNPFVKM